MTAATADSHYDLQMKVKAIVEQLVQHLLPLLLLALLLVVTRLFNVLPFAAFISRVYFKVGYHTNSFVAATPYTTSYA